MSRQETFHLRWRGRVTGPFAWQEVERKLDAHEVGLLHDLQFNNQWTSLGEYLAMRGDFVRVNPGATAAPPPTGADFRANMPPLPSVKRAPKRWIFVTLAIMAGFLGLHDFYAQHWIRGSILLAAAVALWWLDWGIVWPWLWAIGEGVFTQRDGQGRRMPWSNRKQ